MSADNLSKAQSIVERLFKNVDWLSETVAQIKCPGEELHTKPNKESDCLVYIDGYPNVRCFHKSCKSEVADLGGKLRQKLSGFYFTPSDAKAKEARKLTAKARNERTTQESLEILFRELPWPYRKIMEDSPTSIDHTNPEDDWRRLLGLFEPEDVVWIGSLYDSNKTNPLFARYFLPVRQWLSRSQAPGNFVCASTFKPGSHSRCAAQVLKRPFLVVESDHLSKNQVGSIFRWLEASKGLRLRAVVDTGGKSLHGWFDFPDQKLLSGLKRILPRLKCDESLFEEAQPVRLPGAVRNNKYQKLIYLNK